MTSQSELRNAVWQACTAIRNEHRDTKKYVEYTAILLFFKFYDDLFESLPADVQGIIPEEHRWRTLRSLHPRGFAGYDPRVLHHFRLFFEEKKWSKIDGGKKRFGVIFENFQFDIKHDEVLGRALLSLDRIDFAGIAYDQKGDLYEFLIAKMGEAGLAGEFFTPRPVVDMIMEVLKPTFGSRVWDPACGTGGFLSRAFEQMRADLLSRHSEGTSAYNDGLEQLRYRSIYGNETEAVSARLARMNMILRGDGHSTILEFNSLDRETYTLESLLLRGRTESNPLPKIFKEGGFDFVVANPPYGGTQAVSDVGGIFRPWHNSKKPESNFLQVMMQALKPGGRCGVVMPEGILFRRDDMRVRARLLREFDVQAVVGLFKGAFEFADVKACVLFFRRPTRAERWRGTQSFWVAEAVDFNDVDRVAASMGVDSGDRFARVVAASELDPKSLALRPARFLRARVAATADCSVGELFAKVEGTIPIEYGRTYRMVTVRLYGRGAVLRDEVDATEIGTKRQTLVRTGDLVVSRIDARHGAFAVIPPELDGAIVTPDFPVFRAKSDRLSPRLLAYITEFGPWANQLAREAQGTTNRQRVTPEDILGLAIPCPSANEQRAVLRRLDVQRSIFDGARALLHQVAKLDWLDDEIFQTQPGTELSNSLATLVEDASNFVEPSTEPERQWVEYGVSNERGVHRKGRRLGSEYRPGARVKRLVPGTLIYNPMRINVGSIGLMTEDDQDAVGSPDYVTFRCVSGLDPRFALILMKSPFFRNLIRDTEEGAVRPRLYLSQLRTMKVMIPATQRQGEIVRFVDAQFAGYASVSALRDGAESAMRRIVCSLFGLPNESVSASDVSFDYSEDLFTQQLELDD
jgi:type I restriction enzyme M protein